jgi:tetratricopeptide (TPR) repeat protein
MKINLFLLKIYVIFLFAVSSAFSAQSEYFYEGKKLFDDKKYNDSKFFFERDLVFNPKSEKSYLYLAKIFDESENDYEMESNLNKVLLLNPKNEEAIYLLTMLKIKLSDYEEAKQLLEKFNMICESLCSKQKVLQEKLNILTP